MKYKIIMTGIVFATFIFFNAFAKSEMQNDIKNLSAYSKETLGLPLVLVSLLIELNGHPIFLPEERFKEPDIHQRYKKLEAEGYIKIKMKNGLPNGQFQDEKYAWVKFTEKGNNFSNYIKKLE